MMNRVQKPDGLMKIQPLVGIVELIGCRNTVIPAIAQS
jgi:hypothetical protein